MGLPATINVYKDAGLSSAPVVFNKRMTNGNRTEYMEDGDSYGRNQTQIIIEHHFGAANAKVDTHVVRIDDYIDELDGSSQIIKSHPISLVCTIRVPRISGTVNTSPKDIVSYIASALLVKDAASTGLGAKCNTVLEDILEGYN